MKNAEFSLLWPLFSPKKFADNSFDDLATGMSEPGNACWLGME
jgi:hypothetical protein